MSDVRIRARPGGVAGESTQLTKIALLVEAVHHLKGRQILAHDDGDDGRLGVSGVETQRPEAFGEEARVLPEALAALGLLLHDVHRRERGGHDAGGGAAEKISVRARCLM